MNVKRQKEIPESVIIALARRGFTVGRTRPEPYLKQRCDRLVSQGALVMGARAKFQPRHRATYFTPAHNKEQSDD